MQFKNHRIDSSLRQIKYWTNQVLDKSSIGQINYWTNQLLDKSSIGTEKELGRFEKYVTDRIAK